MLKNKIVRLIAVLSAIIVLAMSGCSISSVDTSNASPVANVIVREYDYDNEENSNELEYYVVYSNGGIEETDEFTAETANIYTADYNCFSSEIVDNSIKNTLETVALTDENGEPVNADKNIITMMKLLAEEIDHDIFACKIIEDNGQYFAFVELNVNWWDPCELYQFDASAKEIKMLYQWNNYELIGLAAE